MTNSEQEQTVQRHKTTVIKIQQGQEEEQRISANPETGIKGRKKV